MVSDRFLTILLPNRNENERFLSLNVSFHFCVCLFRATNRMERKRFPPLLLFKFLVHEAFFIIIQPLVLDLLSPLLLLLLVLLPVNIFVLRETKK